MGPELMEAFRKQATRFGARLKTGRVTSVEWPQAESKASRKGTGGPIVLRLSEGETIETRTLIIATGASAKWLGFPNEKRLMGKGVSACATCDGFFFRNQDVVVVGGGDTAMEEASFLTRFAKSVTVVHRRDTLKASKAMQDRAMKNPKIRFVWDSEIKDVVGVTAVEKVVVRNVKTSAVSEIVAQGLFVAVGHEPNTGLFKGKLSMNPSGYLVVEPGSTRTGIPGVFAAVASVLW
jgi:thioredoxin reductase (NADPH)